MLSGWSTLWSIKNAAEEEIARIMEELQEWSENPQEPHPLTGAPK